MKVLRRLYGYLRHYKAWAFLAFGSMIVFALTQTVLAALVQPLIDDVLTPPSVQRVVEKPQSRLAFVDRALQENVPTLYRVKKRFDQWWGGNPSMKWKRVLTILLLIFVVRAFTSFLAEYSFQKVGLS